MQDNLHEIFFVWVNISVFGMSEVVLDSRDVKPAKSFCVVIL